MMRSSRAALYAVPLFTVLLGACATAPDLGPARELADVAPPAAEQSLAGSAQGAWPEDGWWTRFDDPQLTALIEEGLRRSPDLAAAIGRFRAAAGLATAAGAARFPGIEAEGSIYEDRRSLNTGFGDEIKQFLPRGWRSGGRVSADLEYEIDIWGRNRAAYAAATSQAEAAALEAAQARLLLAAGIAQAYVDLGQLYALRDIREAALTIRTSNQTLVSDRLDNGLETRGSLRQADATVATARGNLAAADQEIALRRHQIAALIGAGPDRGLAIARPEFKDVSVDGLPLGVTTGLIGRRPDIVAARARAEAAARRIQVARADFYPALRLDALIGFEALGLGSLFESDSTFGRAGPALSLPLFRGGALRGQYRAARGQYDEAIAQYDRAVIDAYGEVADIATSRALTGERLESARSALEASEEAYEIARLRYKGGLSTYLDVLAVEDRMLDARVAVARLEAEARSLDVALIRGLGGGFDGRAGELAGVAPNG